MAFAGETIPDNGDDISVRTVLPLGTNDSGTNDVDDLV